VKGIRKPQECLAEQKEEIPRKQDAGDALNRAPCAGQSSLPGGTGFRKRFKTRRTDNTIIVLGNTLPAEESSTFQTSRYRLAIQMVQATQMSKIGHVSLSTDLRKYANVSPTTQRHKGTKTQRKTGAPRFI
jgi:hypothetical protein